MTLSAPPAARAANFGRGEAARFRLGPLCRWVMPLGDFDAWVSAALHGETVVYAKGQALARGSATVVLVRELVSAGMLMHLPQAVRPDPETGARETYWSCARVRRDGAAAPVPSPNLSPEGERDAEVLDAIYRAFKRAAQLGLVAPTNGELAKSLDLTGPERARYLVKKLITAGLIRVADQGPRARRIVTITDTGRETVPGVL